MASPYVAGTVVPGYAAAGATVLTARATAQIIQTLLKALAEFAESRSAGAVGFIQQQVTSSFPEFDTRRLHDLLRREEDYEAEFRRKQMERVRGDLAAILAIADPTIRQQKLEALWDRERRYSMMRDDAMLNRALGEVDVVLLEQASPSGAYWKLSDRVIEHTPDCLMMGEKFWPWSVLRDFHPPLHYGCPCALYSLDEAVGEGWMTPEMVPEELDARRRFKQVQKDIAALQEAGITDVGELMEAPLRWAAGTVKGGQFRPKRGGDPGALDALKRLMRHHPVSPATAHLHQRGRWAWMGGQYTHVPEATAFSREVRGKLYTSPAGSTNVYVAGKLISAPGMPAPLSERRSLPKVGAELPSEVADAAEAIREAQRPAVRLDRAPFHDGDGPQALMAALDAGYVIKSAAPRSPGVSHLELQHPQTQNLAVADWDGKVLSKVQWIGRALGHKREPSEGPPLSWEQFREDALAWSDELGARFAVPVDVSDVVQNDDMSDHAGQRDWSGVVNVGRDTRPDMERAADARRAGRKLTNDEARGVWSSYWVAAHEVGHGVNPIEPSLFHGENANLEEALSEEAAHILAVERLEDTGQNDVLTWRDENRDALAVRGVYGSLRGSLGGVLDKAVGEDLTGQERQDFLLDLKFRVPPGERFEYIGEAIHEHDPSRSAGQWEQFARDALREPTSTGTAALPFRSRSVRKVDWPSDGPQAADQVALSYKPPERGGLVGYVIGYTPAKGGRYEVAWWHSDRPEDGYETRLHRGEDLHVLTPAAAQSPGSGAMFTLRNAETDLRDAENAYYSAVDWGDGDEGRARAALDAAQARYDAARTMAGRVVTKSLRKKVPPVHPGVRWRVKSAQSPGTSDDFDPDEWGIPEAKDLKPGKYGDFVVQPDGDRFTINDEFSGRMIVNVTRERAVEWMTERVLDSLEPDDLPASQGQLALGDDGDGDGEWEDYSAPKPGSESWIDKVTGWLPGHHDRQGGGGLSGGLGGASGGKYKPKYKPSYTSKPYQPPPPIPPTVIGGTTDKPQPGRFDHVSLTVQGKPGPGPRRAKDADGKTWFVDAYEGNQNAVASALLANSIYRDLGVPVPELGTITVPEPDFAAIPDSAIPDGPIDAKGRRTSTGIITFEPDGRIWIYEPRNHFGGYEHTFPKGGVEPGLTPQQNAHKELWEETGLHAKIVGVVGDFPGDTSVSRYYIGVRTGGEPTIGDETQAVKLVTLVQARQLLNKQRDHDIMDALERADRPSQAALKRIKAGGDDWPEMKPTLVLANKALDGGLKNTPKGGRAKVAENFMADALLGNWRGTDVAWADENTPLRTDMSSALRGGGSKQFGPVPIETWALLGPRAKDYKGVELSEDERRQQAQVLVDQLSDKRVDELVDAAPFTDDALREETRTALHGRLAWMRDFAEGKIDLPGPMEGDEARAYHADRAKKAKLLKNEFEALTHFGENFAAITSHLRAGADKSAVDEQTRKTIKDLDSAVRYMPATEEDGYVYAGLNLAPDKAASDDLGGLLGKTFEEKSYLPVSFDDSHSRGYAATMRILAPAGSKIFPTHEFGVDMPEGFEAILPRKQRFRIAGKSEKDGKPVVDVVMLPPEKPAFGFTGGYTSGGGGGYSGSKGQGKLKPQKWASPDDGMDAWDIMEGDELAPRQGAKGGVVEKVERYGKVVHITFKDGHKWKLDQYSKVKVIGIDPPASPGTGPLDPFEQIAERHGVEIRATAKNGVIKLSMIRTPDDARRQGRAGAAMRDLIEYADNTGQTIALTPEPTPTFENGVEGRRGASKGALTRWYKGLGFVSNRGRYQDYKISETMVRRPKAQQLALAPPATWVPTLPKPPVFVTSHEAIRIENEHHAAAMYDLAQAGDLLGLKAYKDFSTQSGKLVKYKAALVKALMPPEPVPMTVSVPVVTGPKVAGKVGPETQKVIDRLNAYGISALDVPMGQQRINDEGKWRKMLSSIADEADRLEAKWPGITKGVVMRRQYTQGATLGAYDLGSKTIHMTPTPPHGHYVNKYGRPWAAAQDEPDQVKAIWRHELGHHIDYATGKKWRDLLKVLPFKANGKPVDTSEWARRNLSEYAHKMTSEAIAEMFAAYTAKDYKPGTLPAAVEFAMENLAQRKTYSGAPLNAPESGADVSLSDLHLEGAPDVSADLYRRYSTLPLTAEERHARSAYRTDAYRPVNGALRSGGTHPMVAALDALTHQLPLPMDLTVTRHTHDESEFPNVAVGGTYTEPGFISTTYNGSFIQVGGQDEVVLHVPAGTPAYYDGYDNEDELILGRGLRVRVDRVEDLGEDRSKPGERRRRIEATVLS